MKRTLLILLAICTLASCSKDNGEENSKNIEVTGGKITQEVFADNTQGKESIKFTTTGAWTSSIVSTTKADAPTWLSIDPASGNKAGDYTINIILTRNYTGENRKAEIKISCGGMVITITVEQKALTEDNILPEQPKFDRVVSRIDQIDSDLNRENRYLKFEYDDKMRISTLTSVSYFQDEGSDNIIKAELIIKGTYDESTISFTEEIKSGNSTISGGISMALLNTHGQIEYVKETSQANESQPESTYEYDMSYDANGFLLKTIRKEQIGNPQIALECIWTDGNLTAVNWGRDRAEKAEYGTRLNNKTNLDINWILYNAEGYLTVFGTSAFYSMQGYGGSRNKNMVEKMEVDYGFGPKPCGFSYEFDSEGYPVKVHYVENSDEEFNCTYEITYQKL